LDELSDYKIMAGEKDLQILLKSMEPTLHPGEYVFCTIAEADFSQLNINEIVCFFREEENITVILKQETADSLKLPYSYIASWITLTVHSSLEAVGLTAAFSNALAQSDISCNVIAGYYHDHIFVDRKDASNAMKVLERFKES